MAHLPPNAAIFSPSVARAAASAAKDWSYVDGWLQRKFPGGDPPPFERNADTLRSLLALAAANEAADEERTLVARLEAETLIQLRAHEQSQSQTGKSENTNTDNNALDSAREAILTALETSLTREGQTALTALAALALQTNTPLPTPAALGTELITLSATTSTLEQTTARIHTLTAHLAREAAATAQLATELRPPSPHPHPHDDDDDDDDNNDTTNLSSPNNPHQPTPHKNKTPAAATGYHPPADLAIQNLSLQRQIKILTTRIPELRDRAAAIARSTTTSTRGGGNSQSAPTLSEIRREEEAYTSLLSAKRELDAQVRAFAGLPPDADLARQELEGLRGELRRMTVRRDEVFEGLVERETPRKRGASVRK